MFGKSSFTIRGEFMTITVQVPDMLLEDLATSPEELHREICLAAALHLYSRGLVTQGKASEIARLSRWDFNKGSKSSRLTAETPIDRPQR